MAIKLIATDMDDTLLNPQGELGQRTKSAVSQALRGGVRFVLASGRMPQAMRFAYEELGIQGPVIAYNGALTVDLSTGEVLHSASVPEALAREAAELAEKLGGHVQAYQGGAYYFAQDNAYARAYAESIHLPGQPVGLSISKWLRGDVDKLLVIGEREDISRWVLVMQEHFGTRLSCAVSRPNYIEIFRTGVDKARSLQALCERFSLSKDEVAAFGDGENDLGMIRFAGHGYIMANAREPILKQARHIAPSNAEEGLAQVLEKWLEDGIL